MAAMSKAADETQGMNSPFLHLGFRLANANGITKGGFEPFTGKAGLETVVVRSRADWAAVRPPRNKTGQHSRLPWTVGRVEGRPRGNPKNHYCQESAPL